MGKYLKLYEKTNDYELEKIALDTPNVALCQDTNIVYYMVMDEEVPADEIWYYGSDKLTEQKYDYWANKRIGIYFADFFADADLKTTLNKVSHTFENGKGVVKFNAPIKSIGSYAIFNETSNTALTKIKLPEGVEVIKNGFRRTANLKEIKLPDSLKTLDGYFFGNDIKTIYIGKNLSYISCHEMKNLEKIIVNEENATYDGRDNCNAVIETATNKLVMACKNSTIPSSVTSIYRYAFDYVYDVTGIVIPDTVEEFDMGSYENVTGGTEVVDGIRYWGPIACSVVEQTGDTLTFRNGTKYISGYFLSSSANDIISKINVPEGVTSIGKYAFGGLSDLYEISLPSTLKTIGEWSISYNFTGNLIVKATIPPTLIGSGIFYEPKHKIYVPDSSVEAYKTADFWKQWASIIYPMSDLQ